MALKGFIPVNSYEGKHMSEGSIRGTVGDSENNIKKYCYHMRPIQAFLPLSPLIPYRFDFICRGGRVGFYISTDKKDVKLKGKCRPGFY